MKRARAPASNRGPFVRAVYLVKDRVPEIARYPFSLPAVRSLLRELELHPKVFFIGENGTGESTLVEAIALAAGFNAEGGSRNFRFSTRSSGLSVSPVDQAIGKSCDSMVPEAILVRRPSVWSLADGCDGRHRGPPRDAHEAHGRVSPIGVRLEGRPPVLVVDGGRRHPRIRADHRAEEASAPSASARAVIPPGEASQTGSSQPFL